MIKIYKLILLFSCLYLNSLKSTYSQVPTVQDCLGAIPVCQDTFVQTNAFSGTGNFPGEITYPLCCLASGEKNDVWYTFTVQNSDTFSFTLTPIDPNDDYDWAIFDLTNHKCEDIATIPLQVSCNYSGNNCCNGVTGANYHGIPPGLPQYQQVKPVFYVTAGHTYVLNISNYNSTQSGYTLDFTASFAQIYDNTAPTFDSVATDLSCGDSIISVYFSENIFCSTVSTSDFTFTGPGGPYVITSITSVTCAQGGDYDKTYDLTISPPISLNGLYTTTLVNAVGDLCGNIPLLPANVQVSVNAVALNIVQTDVSCFGGINGTADVQPAGNYTYSWNTIPVQTTQVATGLAAGNYTVTVTPPVGCPSQALVNIQEPAVLDTQSTAIISSNCGATSGSASILVTGGTVPYTYLWAPSGATTSSLSGIPGGSYTVTVTDQHGCTVSMPLTVPFDGITVNVSASQDVNCFGGNDGSATVNVTVGSGVYSYQWYSGSFNPIAGATSATCNSLSAGAYNVVITDAQGCADTLAVTIGQPAAALNAVISAVGTSCGGNNGSSVIATAGGTFPYTFLWSNSATTDTISSLAPGMYTVTVSDANNCSFTVSDSVESSGIPLVNLYGLKDVTCFGGNDGSASVSPSGGVPPYTILWSNGTTNSSYSSFTYGIYIVTVSDNTGCTATESFTINQASQLILNASTGTTICIGQNANLAVVASGGTAPYSYLWSNGNTSNGIVVSPVTTSTYTVTVTDSIGCPSGISSITVTVRPPLSVTLFADSTICRGKTISIPAQTTGGDGTYFYNWNNGLANTPTISVTPTQDTSFSVTVTDNCGTPPDSATVNISLIDAPIVEFLYTPDEGCEPLVVTFTDTSQAPANSTWLWNFGDGTYSTTPNTTHQYNNGGVYDVILTVTNPYECASSLTKNQIINVFNRPDPYVEFDPNNPTLYNPTVHFTAHSNGASSWIWTFGDNSPVSYEQNPVHRYSDTGTYVVKLIESNLNQCVDSIEFIVHVKDEYSFYVPAAFSPDANGKNDVFNVYGVGVNDFEISIFNKWGMLVQKVKNKQPVWDGRFNGTEADAGVYVYVIDFSEPDGRKHQVRGHITLIR